jgi:uncharacterized protein YjbJ (UPF0337 family)
MDKDRIAGAAKTLAGNVKQAVGKLVGDRKTVADRQTKAAEGKIQNAIGGTADGRYWGLWDMRSSTASSRAEARKVRWMTVDQRIFVLS